MGNIIYISLLFQIVPCATPQVAQDCEALDFLRHRSAIIIFDYGRSLSSALDGRFARG
jgi:hypothetical protein